MRIEKFGLNKRTLVAFFLHQGIGAITFVIDIAIIRTRSQSALCWRPQPATS
jgi:hypothetical protein